MNFFLTLQFKSPYFLSKVNAQFSPVPPLFSPGQSGMTLVSSDWLLWFHTKLPEKTKWWFFFYYFSIFNQALSIYKQYAFGSFIRKNIKYTDWCFGEVAQAAPDVRIGGGQRRRAPKIRSKLGGSGGMPLVGIIFLNNAKCCKLGHFSIFFRPLGGAMAHLAPPPWSHLCLGIT